MKAGSLVVVTTDKDQRGVFFGELAKQEGDRVTLKDAQNCVYWSKETRGVFGLAAVGPQPGSRIGPRVPELELVGVTSVSLCTPEAAEVWRSEPWE